MFYDVTLLTGAGVNTFQGVRGKKPASGEKELPYQESVCVRVCVSDDAGSEKEKLCIPFSAHE